MSNSNNAKRKYLFPIILLTVFLTSVILVSIVGVGLYLFLPRNSGEELWTEKQNRKSSPISPSAITKVQYLSYETKTDYSADTTQFLGNVNGSNYIDKSEKITISSDGTATRKIYKGGMLDGQPRPKTDAKFKASFPKENFLELAKTLVENDFLNEEGSTNTTSPKLNLFCKHFRICTVNLIG